jgi:hypothetical protein
MRSTRAKLRIRPPYCQKHATHWRYITSRMHDSVPASGTAYEYAVHRTRAKQNVTNQHCSAHTTINQ